MQLQIIDIRVCVDDVHHRPIIFAIVWHGNFQSNILDQFHRATGSLSGPIGFNQTLFELRSQSVL